MKQNKKRNRAMAIGMVVLVLAVVTSALAGMTYAKYTTKVSSEGTATVAKFAVDVTNGSDTISNTVNLFNTVLDTANGADETDVDDVLIAPGTFGKFTLELSDASEVTVASEGVVTVTNAKNIPVMFYVGTEEATEDSTYDLNAAAFKTALEAELEQAKMASLKTIYVGWMWAYEGGVDTADTTLGTTTPAATLTVKIDVTATQVD